VSMTLMISSINYNKTRPAGRELIKSIKPKAISQVAAWSLF